MPIRDAQRHVIGVAQFVNKLDRTPFSSNDENLFEVSAFAASSKIQYNTKFVKRHVAVASEALANRTVKKHRRRRTNVL